LPRAGEQRRHPAKARTAATQTADTDNIQLQEGDQTSPDSSSQAPEAAGTTAKVASSSKAASSLAESSGETSGEGAGSDGPGGHEDPAGQDVNHEFDGEE